MPVCLRAGSSKHRAGPSANKTKSALEKGPGAGLRLSVLTFPGSVQTRDSKCSHSTGGNLLKMENPRPSEIAESKLAA